MSPHPRHESPALSAHLQKLRVCCPVCKKETVNTLGKFPLLLIVFQAIPLLSMGMHLFSTLKEMVGNKTRRLDFAFLEEQGWRCLCHGKGR